MKIAPLRLIDVYDDALDAIYGPRHRVSLLYRILQTRPRESWISHDSLPMTEEHEVFVASRPYRHWYLVQVPGGVAGELHCTTLNEIGLHILPEYQRQGHGRAAVQRFIQTHEPLPAIKAVRVAKWLAHIAPGNVSALTFWASLGFQQIQVTYAGNGDRRAS